MNEFGREKSEPEDLISENVEYEMEIDISNVDAFPRVEEADFANSREKFVTMIGSWRREGNTVFIQADGVLDCSDDPKIVSQSPGGGELIVDYAQIERFLDEVKSMNIKMSGMETIGDVHTHPYRSASELGRDPWLPSTTDIEEVIKACESGWLLKDRPYVFGISALSKEGKQTMAFYRIIRGKDGKLMPKAFNNWAWSKKDR